MHAAARRMQTGCNNAMHAQQCSLACMRMQRTCGPACGPCVVCMARCQQPKPQPRMRLSSACLNRPDTLQPSYTRHAYAPTCTGSAGGMQDVLNLHNTLRARHGASPLSWDASLASAAQEWANRCVFQHSGGGGENLAQYFSTPVQAVQVCRMAGLLWLTSVLLHAAQGPGMHGPAHTTRTHMHAYARAHLTQAWYDEIRYYDYSAGSFSEATGHATQLLWKGSTQLGCGWAPSCQLFVCRYSPPGDLQRFVCWSACGSLCACICMGCARSMMLTHVCATSTRPAACITCTGNVIGYFTQNVSPPTSSA